MESPPLGSTLDAWNYILFCFEMVMNVVFLPFSLALWYICLFHRNLHPNFRMLLFLANTGNFLQNLHRIIVIVARICTDDNTKVVQNLMLLLDVSACLFLFSWTSLVLERACASWFPGYYESSCSRCRWYPIFALPTILFVGFVALTHIVDGFKPFTSSPYYQYTIISVYVILTVGTALLIPCVLIYNKRIYNHRHEWNMNVATKYQLSENIRATRYILPAAFVALVSKILHTSFICYSVFFTSIPIGQDTSHFSHAYDILLSGTRLLITSWLVMTSDKIGVTKSKRMSVVPTTTRDVEKEHYFNDLHRMWNSQ